jgi:TonB family protein
MGLMKPRGLGAAAVVVALALAVGLPLRAQETKEPPLQAGSEGVPVPKRTKTVPPTYPPEAQAAGIRGIVILELVVDPQGKVESVNVIRSVAGLDDAAVDAAKQWEYEITKVNGKPVSVKLTVPITFAMRLPEVSRQEGIPELRQGAAPAFPEGERGSAEVAADMTVDSDGLVTEIRVTHGEAPWTDNVLRALRTWRFAAPADGSPVSFRVQAEFVPARGRDAQRVALKLDNVRRSESFASTSTSASAPPPTTVASAAAPPPTTTPAAPATIAPPATPATPGGAPPVTVPPAPATVPPAPATVPPAPATVPPPPPTTTPAAPPVKAPPATTPATPPATTPAAPPAGAPTTPSGGKPTTQPAAPPVQAPSAPAAPGPGKTAAAPPPVEVITAPPPPEPPETGSSAIRDVVLAESGVPDLARGRRPVVPPFARMTGTQGSVEVEFSVGASGSTNVQSVRGPDLLRPAAEQTVLSWIFRRTKVDRLFLKAFFNYEGDKVTASVKPQEAPATPPATP